MANSIPYALKRQMANGYKEMGGINLELAERYIQADNEDFDRYERKLSESEKN